jgi:hypothetical protein
MLAARIRHRHAFSKSRKKGYQQVSELITIRPIYFVGIAAHDYKKVPDAIRALFPSQHLQQGRMQIGIPAGATGSHSKSAQPRLR